MARHRLLVTGAGGFVGSVLAELAAGHPLGEEISFVPLVNPDGQSIDIRNAKAVEERIAEVEPTAVIHLAAIASPRLASQQPEEAWAVNVMGTFNLAHAVLKHSPEARFIFAGSSEAYGESFAFSQAPLSEDSPFQPLSPYGATKAAGDIMLGQMARQGLKATRFRPFNHTGPGQPALYVIPSFARQIVRIERGWQEPVMRVGNLEARRDFLDVRDVARAYLDAAVAEEDAIGPFNLSTGKPTTIGEMLETLVAHSTVSIEVETDPALLRPGEIAVVSGNSHRAKEAFGWEPVWDLKDTLAETVAYWRQEAERNPDALKE